LLTFLPRAVRPMVVGHPTSGSNTYAELLAFVRDAVAELPEYYVLGWSFGGAIQGMLASKPSFRTDQ